MQPEECLGALCSLMGWLDSEGCPPCGCSLHPRCLDASPSAPAGNNIALDGSAAASRRLGSAQQSSGSPRKAARQRPSPARSQQAPAASGGAPPQAGAPEPASAPMERPQHGSAEDLSSREPVYGQSQVQICAHPVHTPMPLQTVQQL